MKYLISSKNKTVNLLYWFYLKAFLKTSGTISKTMIPQITSSVLCILGSFRGITDSGLLKICFIFGLCIISNQSFAIPSNTITNNGVIIQGSSTKKNKKVISNTSTFSEDKKSKKNKTKVKKRKLKNNKSRKSIKKQTNTKIKKPQVEKQQSEKDRILLQNKKIKSIWLSSVYMPGLGQIRNNKIWKAGIIWTGFAGLFGGSWYFHEKYTSIDKKSAFKRNKTEINYRVYRNACFVASFFLYVLNILDAYVDAHMTTFDVSKNLSSGNNIVGEEKKRAIKKQQRKNKRRKKRIKTLNSKRRLMSK